MKNISNLINTSSLTVRREEGRYATSLDPHVTEIVNKLFVFFYSICRGFDKQYQDTQRLNVEKTQWIKAFMDIGFNTLGKVQLGVRRCRLEGPINLPSIGQFVKWCTPTPEELGIPGVESAYDEACRNSRPFNSEKKWSHQAVYHAWSLCNSFELANSPKKNTFPLFERNYHITLKMIINGEPLKIIPIAIAHDKESKSKKKAPKGFEHFNSHKEAMEEISRLLGKKIDGSANQGRMQKNSKQARV